MTNWDRWIVAAAASAMLIAPASNAALAANETAKPAAPKPAAVKSAVKPSAASTTVKPKSAPAKAESGPAPVTSGTAPAAVKQGGGEGEIDVKITGQSKEKLVVGKFDPPAAFNLEDIQNFPEDRLQPLLNAPVTFNEGRDFSRMMDFKYDQPAHPWLPDIAKAPFLAMRSPTLEKSSKEWNFAIIDQGGATVFKTTGKGVPPELLSWSGEDSQRGRVAVDTVYIPQLNTVDKEGYHHTYMGQPIQFSTLEYSEGGKTIIELSSKRLFADRKADFSKEGPMLLDKICDVIREGSHLPFAIQPYGAEDELLRDRQQALVKYFKDKLFIPENQIVVSAAQESEKRGNAIAIISNAVPGGSGQ